MDGQSGRRRNPVVGVRAASPQRKPRPHTCFVKKIIDIDRCMFLIYQGFDKRGWAMTATIKATVIKVAVIAKQLNKKGSNTNKQLVELVLM